MIEEIKNKINKLTLLWMGSYYVLYNDSNRIKIDSVHDKKLDIIELLYKDIDSSYIFFKYDKESISFILDIYKDLDIQKSIIIKKDYGIYLYPMRNGNDNLWVFCDEFIYVQNTYRFLVNNLL